MRGTGGSRILAIGLLLVRATPAIGPAQELRPLMLGWEQHFSVTWEAVQRRGATPAARYRVSVFSYDRIDQAAMLMAP
jgi:hypothetical protein